MVNIINLAMAACPCHVWAHKDTHKQQATAYLWTPTQKTKTMRGCGTRGHELVVDVVALGWCLVLELQGDFQPNQPPRFHDLGRPRHGVAAVTLPALAIRPGFSSRYFCGG